MKYFKRELDVISAAKPAIALGKYLTQQGARSFDVFEKQYTKIH
jgi:hypothetical protein